MDRYARYEVRFERSYYRAIKELRRLKTDAALRDTLPKSDAANLPDLVSPQEIHRAKRSQQNAHDEIEEQILGYAMGLNPPPFDLDSFQEQFDPNEIASMPSK